jgi:hypothetical protein
MRTLLSLLSILTIFLFFYFSHYNQKNYVVLQAREGAGMFSMFSDVLGLLNAYEQGKVNGLEIDFGKGGVYFSEHSGDNWWMYYCEPIQLGSKKHTLKGTFGDVPNLPEREFWGTRKQAYQIIQKYIRFKPYILEKVERFSGKYFDRNVVIGVHYRGTDWFTENAFTFLDYSVFAKEVQKTIQALGNPTHFQIFIATDEKGFIEYMGKMFPNHICYLQDNYRSSDKIPLHKDSRYNPAKQGEEAILDCLLLSKSDYFIGTCSNLSQWALMLNPEMHGKDLTNKIRWLSE